MQRRLRRAGVVPPVASRMTKERKTRTEKGEMTHKSTTTMLTTTRSERTINQLLTRTKTKAGTEQEYARVASRRTGWRLRSQGGQVANCLLSSYEKVIDSLEPLHSIVIKHSGSFFLLLLGLFARKQESIVTLFGGRP